MYLSDSNLIMATGKIYLIPVTLGGVQYNQVIPEYVLDITRSLRFFIVEEIRSARRYLRMIDKGFPIDDSVFYVLNEHTGETEIEDFLKPLKDGNDIGLMSEAGLPGIADPGAMLIRAAHEMNIRVVPLSGPSSVLLGLIASGLNGQNFNFHGYLPIKPEDRNSKIKEIEKRAGKGETQIFMETPYRAQKVFESLISVCHPDSKICVATDITLPTEEIKTMRVSEWKKKIPNLNQRLVVFLMGK